MPVATADFEVTDQKPKDSPFAADDDGVAYGHLVLVKRFHGDIEASSEVDMLFTRTPDGAGGFAGAAYVALERISGTVHGRTGSFALLHASTVTAGDETWARWPISPGSGTGELAGIAGEGRIVIAEDGSHTFTLEYQLG
jgi:Protein of unknown function (DUF3224)